MYFSHIFTFSIVTHTHTHTLIYTYIPNLVGYGNNLRIPFVRAIKFTYYYYCPAGRFTAANRCPASAAVVLACVFACASVREYNI